eukprot:8944665-Alexandrium_andersonii.AAC.1
MEACCVAGSPCEYTRTKDSKRLMSKPSNKRGSASMRSLSRSANSPTSSASWWQSAASASHSSAGRENNSTSRRDPSAPSSTKEKLWPT